MERCQTPLSQKSNSFSSSSSNHDDKLHTIDRNLSLGPIHLEDKPIDKDKGDNATNEEEKKKKKKKNKDVKDDKPAEDIMQSNHLLTIFEDIDRFLDVLHRAKEENEKDGGAGNGPLPDIPESTIKIFVEFVEIEIEKHQAGEEKLVGEHHKDNETSFLNAVNRMWKLTCTLSPLASSDYKFFDMMNLTGCALYHAMSFLEDEFCSLMEEFSRSDKDNGSGGGSSSGSSKGKRLSSSVSRVSQDHARNNNALVPSADTITTTPTPADYHPSAETLTKLRAIAKSMISAGYEVECRQVFLICRQSALRASMSDLGYEELAIDDIQHLAWEMLEGEIGKWIKVFRQVVTTSLPMERDICYSVFAGYNSSTGTDIFLHLVITTVRHLLNFAEAVTMTKRSAEKLFKMLDVYEAVRDAIPKIGQLFLSSDDSVQKKEEVVLAFSQSAAEDLKSEVHAVQLRLGEAAVFIFCELESSIKSDIGKNAVPGGAVHPLTRYVMNYLKYACEYIKSLEQIFNDHANVSSNGNKSAASKPTSSKLACCSGKPAAGSSSNSNSNSNSSTDQSPIEAKLIQVMDLLQLNLDSKAKLYKDLALSNIFLMNNGRYIVQRIKGSAEINNLLGNTWCRKRSSELRQYHKNYQRETWSKVLACFKEEGLTVKGSVSKPILKERFKSFNVLFEEIHKVQGTWVVSDEQLRSELRVSICAVVVPAYRSFLARFGQYFSAGRQTEKYVKFGPEELETLIDELFDGNPCSMVRKKP